MVSGRFDISPFGELRTKEAEMTGVTVDTETAYALGGSIDFQVARNISLGFSPRYFWRIKGEPYRDSGSQLDLSARIKAFFPASPRAELFGFLAPGYSMIFIPEDTSIFSGLDPSGLILGIGGGANIMVSQKAFITLELGYTWGFQSDSEAGFKYVIATNLFHLGLGLGTRF